MRKRPDPPFFRVPRSTGKRNSLLISSLLPSPHLPALNHHPQKSNIFLLLGCFFLDHGRLEMSSQSHSFCIIYFRVKIKLLIILYGSLRSAALAKNLLSLALKILIITTSKSFYFNQDQEYILSLKQIF